MPPLSADLIAYGLDSNAGDVLIRGALEKLFDKTLHFNFHHVRVDRLNCDTRNIVIGPGGLLSGSYDPTNKPDELVIRHLTEGKVTEWVDEKKQIFFFGTGTNTAEDGGGKPFSPASSAILRKLVAASRLVMLRGSADIVRISSLCRSEDLAKFRFQPCPSVFLDRLFDEPPRLSDRIAVNFPLARVINKDNFRSHSLNRFISYARALGLTVSFMDNHPADFNPYVMEMFDEVGHEPSVLDAIVRAHDVQDEKKKTQVLSDIYTKAWDSKKNLPSRFNGFRFAFGNRLHSFLPFMAFDTPSMFMAAHPIRRPMPVEYFKHPVFGAPVPFGGKNGEAMVNGMIERLEFFTRNEERLRSEIQAERARLWDMTLRNKWDLLESIQ